MLSVKIGARLPIDFFGVQTCNKKKKKLINGQHVSHYAQNVKNTKLATLKLTLFRRFTHDILSYIKSRLIQKNKNKQCQSLGRVVNTSQKHIHWTLKFGRIKKKNNKNRLKKKLSCYYIGCRLSLKTTLLPGTPFNIILRRLFPTRRLPYNRLKTRFSLPTVSFQYINVVRGKSRVYAARVSPYKTNLWGWQDGLQAAAEYLMRA